MYLYNSEKFPPLQTQGKTLKELWLFHPKSVSPQLKVVSPQLKVVLPQLKVVSPPPKVSSPEVFSCDLESNKWLNLTGKSRGRFIKFLNTIGRDNGPSIDQQTLFACCYASATTLLMNGTGFAPWLVRPY